MIELPKTVGENNLPIEKQVDNIRTYLFKLATELRLNEEQITRKVNQIEESMNESR